MEVRRQEGDEPAVAVIGGGIGGLAAAIALQRAGIGCTVYERDDSFKQRREGFGLTLTNNPKGPLAALGLLESCIDTDCPSTCHWVFNPQGNILGYYGRYFKEKANALKEGSVVEGGVAGCCSGGLKIRDRGNLRVPRQDLREMLLQQLKPGTVQWSRKLLSITDNPDCEHVELRFEGRDEPDRAHVVVGADGIRSQVRHLRDTAVMGLCGQSMSAEGVPGESGQPASLSYLGVSVIIGISPVTSPLLHHQGFYVVDGMHRLFTMPFRSPESSCAAAAAGTPELVMWQLSFSGLSADNAKALKGMPAESLIKEALSRTAHWFGAVNEMIAASLLSDVWATPLYDRLAPVLIPRGKDCLSRLTVLGDACHPMSMFKGQGANQALQDGVLLAKWLGGESVEVGKKRRRLLPSSKSIQTVATRLRCFEREMVDRAAPKVAASRIAAGDYHSASALQTMYGIEGLELSEENSLDLSSPGAFLGIGAFSELNGDRNGLERLVWERYLRLKGEKDKI